MPKLTKKQTEAKKLLRTIARFLNGKTEIPTVRDFWSILTALRGPDFGSPAESHKLKMRTTARIRGAIGISETDAHGVFISEETPVRETVLDEEWHFFSHHNAAVDALINFGFIEAPVVLQESGPSNQSQPGMKDS